MQLYREEATLKGTTRLELQSLPNLSACYKSTSEELQKQASPFWHGVSIYEHPDLQIDIHRPGSAGSPPLTKLDVSSARSDSAGSAPETKSPIMAQLHGEAVKKILSHSRAISPSGALPTTPPHGQHRKPLGITPLPLPLSPAHRHASSPSSTSSSSSFQRLSRCPTTLRQMLPACQ